MSILLRLSCAAFLIALLAASPPALAQTPEDARRISLDEAVDIALRQSIPLAQAENEVEQRRIAVASERMDFAPGVSLSLGGGQSYGRSFLQNEGQVVNRTASSVRAGIGANINVFNGFGDAASLAAAKHRAEAGRHSLTRARQEIIFQVVQNYLALIGNREQVQVQEKNVNARRSRLAQIEAGVSVGTLPASDLYRQQAQVAVAERDFLRAQHAFRISVINLQQLLQLDPNGVYEFVAPPLQATVAAAPTYELNALLESAYERRPDLDAQRQSIQAAEENIRAARSGYWPRVGLSLNYGSNYSDVVPLAFQDQFIDRNRGGGISLSLSMPIFDRLTTHHAVQQQQVSYRNAQLGLMRLRDQVALEVRQAYLDYELARKQLDVTQTQVTAAEKALEAEEARYEAGLITLVALNEAQASYVQATSDRIATRYTYLFRMKMLDYFAGRLDPDVSFLP